MPHHVGVYSNIHFVLEITKVNNLHKFYAYWGKFLIKKLSQSNIDATVHGENVIIPSEVLGLNPSDVSSHFVLRQRLHCLKQ